MRRILALLAIVSLLGLSAGTVRAESLELLDGNTVAGEIVLPPMADGLNIHLYNGKYQKVPWDNFSQASLAKLAKTRELASFVNPLLEKTEEARAERQEIQIRQPDHLARPAKGSLFGALFHTKVGLFALTMIWLAGIYAGYEISVVRSYPPVLVCAVSALAPFVGQALFLCLPSQMVVPEDEAAPLAQEPAHAEAQWAPRSEKPAVEEKSDEPEPKALARPSAPVAIPETQVFAKGQFMFNRRFFETKFPGFFGLVRKDADKHMILVIRSARGEFEAHRISRITANEMFVDGSGSPIPFIEILEVQLKHENA